MTSAAEAQLLATATAMRWEFGGNLHEQLVEAIYADAARIAERAVTRPDQEPRFDLDRTIDRVVTSRLWGFPIMLLALSVVLWLTVIGSNIPSDLLFTVLIDKIYPFLKQIAVNV